MHTDLDAKLLTRIQAGTLATTYKGRALLKSPFDMALYLRVVQQIRPGAIIEIGVNEGGSVLWFADMMSSLGLDARVVGVDLAPPAMDDKRISLLTGDALSLGETLKPEVLGTLPHPWLVIDDSNHTFDTSLAVLRFFDSSLRLGDYMVVEDGVVAFLEDPGYRLYEEGPTRALAQFVEETDGRYEVDRSYCDFYGHNVTYNPEGWLRRCR